MPAGESERRFCVLDVSDRRVGDFDYFDKLYEEIKNGGAERFLYRLLYEVEIDWNFISRPLRTEALLEQQLDSMDGLRRWWMETLRTGWLPGGGNMPLATEVYDGVRKTLGDK